MSVMPSIQRFKKNPDGSYSVTEKLADYGKVTGTQISGLLNMNPWQTPFSTAVRMMRLYNEDISDKPAIRAGVSMEPKILDYFGAVHGDDVFQKREGDHETWVSDFQDPIFGGHIDGMLPDGSIVEVKTSSRPQDWDGKIPLHYHLQASLYAHFFKTERIVFLVGFTDYKTIQNPDSWVPTKDNTIRVDTGIIDGFDVYMEDAKRIYEETVLKGITPVPNPNSAIDNAIVEYLDAQLWTEDDASSQIAGYIRRIDNLDMLNDLKKEADHVKELIQTYMTYNDIGNIHTQFADVDKVTYTRTAIDSNALKKDGIYDIYTKEKEYTSIKVKVRK